MEWTSVEEMERDVRESVVNGLRVCYGSCCHDLQTEEQHRQHSLLERLERYRQQGRETKNERQANAAFVFSDIAAALLHHLQVWLLLKSDRMEDAWIELVEAQESLRRALRFVDDDLFQQWYVGLLASERLLFPPQRFVSSSHTFGYAECTICEKIYGECEHVVGRMYMGKLCGKRPRDLSAINHVAIVDHPRDKGCRWTKVKRDGYMYCTLTLRQLEQAGDDEGDAVSIVLRAR